MSSILIIAPEDEVGMRLLSSLAQMGFACSIASDGEGAVKRVIEQAPDLVLVAANSHPAKMRELCQGLRLERQPPIIALASTERLDSLDVELIDDFVIEPYDVKELALRIKRLLKRTRSVDTSEVIECGDLVIDLARCEVSVAGRLVVLTFREYELLRFLAKSRGRVFTREALLNKVWGYDYYGGDRTVDVHIRRLRSKIEDANHTFIETVRNIGYRFKRNI
jgi:DNA-binding response OmpR family regulator